MALIGSILFLCIVCILEAFGSPVIFTNGVAERRQHIPSTFIPSDFNTFSDVDYILLPDLSQNFDSFDYDSVNFDSNSRRFSSNRDFKSERSREGDEGRKATSQTFFRHKKTETNRQSGFSGHSQSSFFFQLPPFPIRTVITEDLSSQPEDSFHHLPPVAVRRPFAEKTSSRPQASSFHHIPTVQVVRPFVEELPNQFQAHSFHQQLNIPVRKPFTKDSSSEHQAPSFQPLPTVSVKKPFKGELQSPSLNQFLTVPAKRPFTEELSDQPKVPSFQQLPTVLVKRPVIEESSSRPQSPFQLPTAPAKIPLVVESSDQHQSSFQQLQNVPVSKPFTEDPTRSDRLLASIIGGIRKDIFNNQNPINQIQQQQKKLINKPELKNSKEFKGPLQVSESIPISTIVKFPDNQNSHSNPQPTVSRSKNLLSRIIEGIKEDMFKNEDKITNHSDPVLLTSNPEERSQDISAKPSLTVEHRTVPEKLEQVPERLEQIPESQHFPNEEQQNENRTRSQILLGNIMSSIQRDIFDSEKFI